MEYRPKSQIALEELDWAKANQVHLDWITFDEGYGKAPEFICGLDERQLLFAGEVPKGLSCLAVNGSGQRPDAQVKGQRAEDVANGWLIGSGAVESACKTVVGQRLKLAGMRWGEDGADAVCHLRALFKSERGQWRDFWQRSIN